MNVNVNVTLRNLNMVYEEHAILTDTKIVLYRLSMRIIFNFQSEFSV